jgi:hypothetical protein
MRKEEDEKNASKRAGDNENLEMKVLQVLRLPMLDLEANYVILE